jgi:hypothetical protein
MTTTRFSSRAYNPPHLEGQSTSICTMMGEEIGVIGANSDKKVMGIVKTLNAVQGQLN